MLVLVNFTNAQKMDIPKNVNKTFVDVFSHNPTEKIKWSKTSEGWYAVTFESYEVKNYALIHPDGYVLENGVQIVFDDLLERVQKSFLNKYSEEDIDSIYRIYSAAAPERNKIIIKGKNGSKTSLYYNHQGTLYLEK